MKKDINKALYNMDAGAAQVASGGYIDQNKVGGGKEPKMKKPPKVKPLRKLPNYTKGEEIFNMVTHAVGAVMGVVILIMSTIKSALNQNYYGITGAVIFGLTTVMLYTMSAVYHGVRNERGKLVLQVLDHCTIYLLIAGTYTPILLSGIRPQSEFLCWLYFGIEWGVAALATTLTAIDMRKFKVFSFICYIVLGWGIIAIAPVALTALGVRGFTFLLLGGVAYTIGSILYGLGRKHKYMHSVFHIFCLLGTFFHFLTVLCCL